MNITRRATRAALALTAFALGLSILTPSANASVATCSGSNLTGLTLYPATPGSLAVSATLDSNVASIQAIAYPSVTINVRTSGNDAPAAAGPTVSTVADLSDQYPNTYMIDVQLTCADSSKVTVGMPGQYYVAATNMLPDVPRVIDQSTLLRTQTPDTLGQRPGKAAISIYDSSTNDVTQWGTQGILPPSDTFQNLVQCGTDPVQSVTVTPNPSDGTSGWLWVPRPSDGNGSCQVAWEYTTGVYSAWAPVTLTWDAPNPTPAPTSLTGRWIKASNGTDANVTLSFKSPAVNTWAAGYAWVVDSNPSAPTAPDWVAWANDPTLIPAGAGIYAPDPVGPATVAANTLVVAPLDPAGVLYLHAWTYGCFQATDGYCTPGSSSFPLSNDPSNIFPSSDATIQLGYNCSLGATSGSTWVLYGKHYTTKTSYVCPTGGTLTLAFKATGSSTWQPQLSTPVAGSGSASRSLTAVRNGTLRWTLTSTSNQVTQATQGLGVARFTAREKSVKLTRKTRRATVYYSLSANGSQRVRVYIPNGKRWKYVGSITLRVTTSRKITLTVPRKIRTVRLVTSTRAPQMTINVRI